MTQSGDRASVDVPPAPPPPPQGPLTGEASDVRTPGATAEGHSAREWAWRRRLREKRTTYQFYRAGVATVGLTIIVTGLILVPLPGPGWLIVFLGVGVLASEFPWARRLHTWASAHLRRWNAWILASPWWVRITVATATFLFVCACFWVLFKLAGLPPFFPEWATSFLHTHAFL